MATLDQYELIKTGLMQDLLTGSVQVKVDETKEVDADVESFLLDMLSIFPLLGLSVFEKTETTSKPGELLFIEAKGIKATGYEDPKGFVVIKGSETVKEETNTIPPYITTLRKDLVAQGVMFNSGNVFTFTQDQVFTSPSNAAAVVQARSANGRDDWKNKTGKTLKQIQEAASKQDGASNA